MRHDPALDGLRAVAIIVVMLFHLGGGRFVSPLPGGWIGVEVFFVLSGFLITTILVREIDANSTINLKAFYWRRFIRLTPPLWLMLIVVLGFSVVWSGYQHEAVRATLLAGSYTMNWLPLLKWQSTWFQGHTWSLGVEEQFYLVWPAILLTLSRRWWLPSILAAIGLIVAWRLYVIVGTGDDPRYLMLTTNADMILAGCAFALWTFKSPGEQRIHWVASSMIALGFVAFCLLIKENDGRPSSLGTLLALIGGVLMLIAARRQGWLRNLLSSSPLGYVGRISYSLYLWHWPIYCFLIFQPSRHRLLAIVLSVVFAMLSYHLFERPLARYRNCFRVDNEPDNSRNIQAANHS